MTDEGPFQALAKYLRGSAPNIYIELDAEGTLKGSNPYTTKIFGRDLTGATFREILPDVTDAGELRGLAQEPDRIHRVSIATHTTLSQHALVSFIPSDNGTIIVGTIDFEQADSSEKILFELKEESCALSREPQERNAELDLLKKQMSHFLSSIRHQLRTPMNGISGFSELLRQEFYGPLNSKQLEYVEGIESSGKLLNEMLDNFLDSAEVNSGELKFELAHLNVDGLSETTHQNDDHTVTPHRILVVDDNHTNRILMENLLNVHHHDVAIANNGKEAIEMCLRARPDLIFMDVVMPEMDGLEATQELRKISDFRDLPIIALTANSDPDSIQETIQAGCNAHLTKPINSKEIFSMIHRFLGSDTNPQP